MENEWFTYKFPCGLRLIQHVSPQPVAYVGLRVAAGSRHEDAGLEGMAHFCEHMSFKGTYRRSAREVAKRLESVGGDLNAFTTKEDTTFHAAIGSHYLMRAIDLLNDITFHSTYQQSEAGKEVEVICDEIESYNDSPADLIYDEFENIVFKGHPLGHGILGNAERVRTFTGTDGRDFTRRFYRPNRSVLFIDGGEPLRVYDFDKPRLRQLLPVEWFEPDNSQEKPVSVESVEKSVAPSPWKMSPDLMGHTIVHKRNTHQVHVMMGGGAYTVADPRRPALQLLNNMLGGPGMNARLNVVLREQRGLVYTVESSMTGYDDAGLWTVYFGCDPKDVHRCLRLVKGELHKAITRPPTAHALAVAKQQLKGQLLVASDNREYLALDFAKWYLHHGDILDIDTICADIDKVTVDDLMETARLVVDPDHLVTLIYE